jgi:hypothetical protein
MATRIINPAPPNLPLGTDQYDRRYQDQFANVLRLYFNQLRNALGELFGNTGGKFLAFPYAAIQRTTDKTFTANTATLVTFDQNDYLNGCTNDGTDGIVVQQAGIYNYQFSVQWRNSDTQLHDSWIWLRKNGTDIPGTSSQFSVAQRHGGVDGHTIAAANFYVDLNAGDFVSLYAAVNDVGVTMDASAAQTVPFGMPAIPSVVATLSFVSALPA